MTGDAIRAAGSVAAFFGTVDPAGSVVAGGAGVLLLGLAGYLFKELRRKDDSVWMLMAEKDRENARLRERAERAESRAERAEQDRDFWRGTRLADEDEAVARLLEERRRQRELGSGEDR